MKIRNCLVVLTFAFALAACANAQLKNYAAVNKPLAENGQIKWSIYYSGLYDEVLNSSVPNRGSALERIAVMIQVSQAFESGNISKEQFDHMTRLTQAAQATDDDAQRDRSRVAMAAALQGISQSYQQSSAAAMQRANSYAAPATTVRTNCVATGNQVDCTTK